ncbi:MAG: C39 family peptidase [Candidatus Thermoplasmatota archaeon]|nr:C39 family peptidase [Candidatus Thermoplasmatota archaeon]MBU1940620.1 C39 family peptidase [Candidatus Thermoplasmatota archaeon]
MQLRHYLTTTTTLVCLLTLSICSASQDTRYLTQSYPCTIPESYIISEVPYVPQSEGYFCYYATLTMYLQYLGHNLTLNELIFYDGLGFTHSYHPKERLPHQGLYADIPLIYHLFDIEQHQWTTPIDPSTDDSWDLYYTNIQENISHNTPIITLVNPFGLPSLRHQFPISDTLWNLLFPPSIHVILLVGYNDTNHSICYHDPNAGFYGSNTYGEYAWMDLTAFKTAVETNRAHRYSISTLIQHNQTYSSSERFSIALSNNKEKIMGIYPQYTEITGIPASQHLESIFSTQEDNRTVTIQAYKTHANQHSAYTLKKIAYTILHTIYPAHPTIFDILIIGLENPYEKIAYEKQHVADYLAQASYQPSISHNLSILLNQEAQYWDILSSLYSNFLRRGQPISNYRAQLTMNYMENTIKTIISLEEQIVETCP